MAAVRCNSPMTPLQQALQPQGASSSRHCFVNTLKGGIHGVLGKSGDFQHRRSYYRRSSMVSSLASMT